jgi:hypothetical protein
MCIVLNVAAEDTLGIANPLRPCLGTVGNLFPIKDVFLTGLILINRIPKHVQYRQRGTRELL